MARKTIYVINRMEFLGNKHRGVLLSRPIQSLDKLSIYKNKVINVLSQVLDAILIGFNLGIHDRKVLQHVRLFRLLL